MSWARLGALKTRRHERALATSLPGFGPRCREGEVPVITPGVDRRGGDEPILVLGDEVVPSVDADAGREEWARLLGQFKP